ncbi:hypothetical protein [Hydrogenophaga sp. 5NK40-0174]|uniref:hypothetical protein n=1 Tax=Hydrogenophaga sp. 5NK40-0174 TaxID=3127649 RepID=UPI0031025651
MNSKHKLGAARGRAKSVATTTTTTRTKAIALAAACLFALGLSAAHADQEVSVGRVDVQLPGEGWRVVSIDDRGNRLVGPGLDYRQTAESKVMVHLGEDKVLNALVVVRANVSGRGRSSGVRYPGAKCVGPSEMFSEGDPTTPAPTSFRCLQVTAEHDLASSPALDDATKAAIAKEGWVLPPSVFFATASQYANTAAFAHVVAVVRPLAPMGAPGTGDSETALPPGVSASSVQWARQLQEAVTDSVYSFGGDLEVPPLKYAEAVAQATETPAPASEPAPEAAEKPAE